MIHARLDLSKSRHKAVGTFHGSEGPQVWFSAEGITIPDSPGENCAGEIECGQSATENEEELLLILSLMDAAALSTLLDQSVLACINSQGRSN